MLTIFHHEHGRLMQMVPQEPLNILPLRTVWVDLLNPSREDEHTIERILGLEIPTREDMEEIEVSSRLYMDRGAMVMTMPVLNKSATIEPESAAVTFIVTDKHLVTVRYVDPAPFGLFIRQITAEPLLAESPEQAFLGLLEQVTDRLADILESATGALERTSRHIFLQKETGVKSESNYKEILFRIGNIGDLASKAKDSLLGLTRLLAFYTGHAKLSHENKVRLETLHRDVTSIDEHALFLSNKTGFLLDATLGLINYEQNNIIKIFSVAAVTFLPPTLIASIYGMNFESIPELKWELGYPLAILLMILSATVPFLYFRRKKWL